MRKSSVHSKVERVSVNETFRDVFNSATNDVNVSKLDVFASPNLSRNGEVSVDCDEPISFIDQLFSVKSTYMLGTKLVPVGDIPIDDSDVPQNAFDVLMNLSARFLPQLTEDNKKIKLYNVHPPYYYGRDSTLLIMLVDVLNVLDLFHRSD